MALPLFLVDVKEAGAVVDGAGPRPHARNRPDSSETLHKRGFTYFFARLSQASCAAGNTLMSKVVSSSRTISMSVMSLPFGVSAAACRLAPIASVATA